VAKRQRDLLLRPLPRSVGDESRSLSPAITRLTRVQALLRLIRTHGSIERKWRNSVPLLHFAALGTLGVGSRAFRCGAPACMVLPGWFWASSKSFPAQAPLKQEAPFTTETQRRGAIVWVARRSWSDRSRHQALRSTPSKTTRIRSFKNPPFLRASVVRVEQHQKGGSKNGQAFFHVGHRHQFAGPGV
jgi:hypothetical protein